MKLLKAITEARDRRADQQMRQYRRDRAEYEQARIDQRWNRAQTRRRYLRSR